MMGIEQSRLPSDVRSSELEVVYFGTVWLSDIGHVGSTKMVLGEANEYLTSRGIRRGGWMKRVLAFVDEEQVVPSSEVKGPGIDLAREPYAPQLMFKWMHAILEQEDDDAREFRGVVLDVGSEQTVRVEAHGYSDEHRDTRGDFDGYRFVISMQASLGGIDTFTRYY